jgi:hypothetical protein
VFRSSSNAETVTGPRRPARTNGQNHGDGSGPHRSEVTHSPCPLQPPMVRPREMLTEPWTRRGPGAGHPANYVVDIHRRLHRHGRLRVHIPPRRGLHKTGADWLGDRLRLGHSGNPARPEGAEQRMWNIRAGHSARRSRSNDRDRCLGVKQTRPPVQQQPNRPLQQARHAVWPRMSQHRSRLPISAQCGPRLGQGCATCRPTTKSEPRVDQAPVACAAGGR